MNYKRYKQTYSVSLYLIIGSLWSMHFNGNLLHAKKRVTINQNEAFPSMDDFYADDSQRNLKLSIEEMMGLYLVDPPRRHKSEMTEIKNNAIHFRLWYPIAGKDIQTLKSIAIGWLVLGRTQYASGVQGLFSDLPDIDRVSLTFHEIDRADKKKGQSNKNLVDTIYPYLLISITRKDFERLPIETIRQCSLNLDCDEKIRRAFLLKINGRYLKRKRK